MTKLKWNTPTEGLREIVQSPYLISATPSKSQGEIKSDYSDWARAHAFERDHPKIAKAIHFIPIANSVFTGMKSGRTRPDKIAVGQALVSDAIQLAGVGKAAQSIGIAPAIITDVAGNIGAYGGNELGEHVVKNNYVSADVAPYVIPVSTILGGIFGGSIGYKGGNKALKYAIQNDLLPEGAVKNNLVTEELAKEAVTEAFVHTVETSKVPTRYGKIKWYGPTMGKTTATKTNANLVDFDEISRHGLEKLAKNHGMTKQELMMSQDPVIRNEAKQLLKQMLDDWRLDPASEGKTLVVSKSDVLDYDFDNTPLMLQREEFLRRNAARGETDVANSNNWYNSVMEKGKGRIITWPDEKGVYISQIEPSTTNPYSRQVVPDRNMPTIAPYKSAYYGNFMEGEKFSPLEVTDYFKMGKDAAGKFFEHPVVKAAEEHNIALAKKLGISLHPRPKDISTVVQRPMPLKIHTEGPEAFVAQGHYNDPHAYMSVKWAPVTKEWMNQMGRHEGLHLGFYSAPFRPTNLTHEYYQNVYQPEARFWIMKTDKLLKPEYRIMQNGVIQDSADDVYITDWRGGEAGPNLIDMGRELGLKLGQPYPGDEVFMNMMNNYKGAKSFLLKFLDTDTRAGRRHIWDAMVGKYFAIPAAAAVSSVASESNQQNPYKNETRK